MNYLVNFVLIILRSTPPLLRMNPFRSFMELFARVLNAVNQEYVYTISHTGQVTSLEHYLNGKYGLPYALPTRETDIVNGSIIYILGTPLIKSYLYNKYESKPPLWIYNKPENKPLFLYNHTESISHEFTIYVPLALVPSYTEIKLRAFANQYVIAGKRYLVQTY